MHINSELLKGGTPVLILKLLSREDLYGYEIIKKLTLLSENAFQLKEGSLYPILKSLEYEGYVKSYWEETASARKRKYYHITQNGQKKLESLETEWNYYVISMKKILHPLGE